ncbi:MAG: FAD-dependent oxidoreductase [Acidimicrobiales bacterium]|nr:FAD-dependent oxidoreductase [Acidimicrobiales bacterium]
MNDAPHRLPHQPGEVIDRDTPVRFSWNGRRMTGFAGDTIASAISSNGKRIFSRSMKYHRPRGLLTADYWDPNLFVQIGPEPNVRAGHRLIADGMQVKPQNVWPSLGFDVKAANGLVGRFLTAGFYYKTFMNPASLWPLYEKVLATFAPGGEIDLDAPHELYDQRYAHVDVLIAGGGPAGLSAAVAAAERGASVMLVEHNHHLGGHLRWGDPDDLALSNELVQAVRSNERIEVLTDSTVTGRYEDNWCAINQRTLPHAVERLVKVRAKSLIVAAGLIERPLVFEGNDHPGVMLGGAARRLINLYAVKPGERAVVLTANDEGDKTVAALERAGVEIAQVVDARRGEAVHSASGSKGVSSVTLGDRSKVSADLLITSIGWTAPTSLLNMAGDRPVYNPSAARFFPDAPPETVLVTGGLAGDGSVEQLVAHGVATGRLAADRAAVIRYRLQTLTPRAIPPEGSDPDWPADARTPLGVDDHPSMFRALTHGIVDYSEDVSSKDLEAAADEAYDSVELVKRYTTATMGPQQGKLETVNTVAVLAEHRGQAIAEVGTTVWRPPYAPISLGALAGRAFDPVRYSALHRWHMAHGGVPMVAGQWIRIEQYGNPAEEVRNTRANVGLIDVSPLGKMFITGPDAPKLLEQLYVNKWSRLPLGGVRYGVMVNEDGVVMDDGVTGRLTDDTYLMTTTTGGAGRVYEWAEMWLQTEKPEFEVFIDPVTAGFTSINVAGPNSRQLMSRVTDGLDLSNEAFPYMNVRTARVAGVSDCIVWRIGFTGELSYEVHVPAGFGLHVWEELLAHGADLGVAPFGVEAQRIMRLEKGHFIVGQDTDGLTQLPTTGLASLAKLDKPDSAGKPELQWAIHGPGPRAHPVLVLLEPSDPAIVPAEACQIVNAGTTDIVGRVTSSRFSPTLERSICLAQVEPSLATPGTEVTVVLTDGERITASVKEGHAFYDQEGVRTRG